MMPKLENFGRCITPPQGKCRAFISETLPPWGKCLLNGYELPVHLQVSNVYKIWVDLHTLPLS